MRARTRSARSRNMAPTLSSGPVAPRVTDRGRGGRRCSRRSSRSSTRAGRPRPCARPTGGGSGRSLAVVHERDRVPAGRLHPLDGHGDDGAGARDRGKPRSQLVEARRARAGAPRRRRTDAGCAAVPSKAQNMIVMRPFSRSVGDRLDAAAGQVEVGDRRRVEHPQAVVALGREVHVATGASARWPRRTRAGARSTRSASRRGQRGRLPCPESARPTWEATRDQARCSANQASVRPQASVEASAL